MLTDEEFAAKIEREGGIFGVLEYGLRPDEIEPGAVKDAYYELWDSWSTFMKSEIADLERALENVAADK